MPFDFFNPSDLAFGGKLRSAFHQLNDLVKSAEENVDQYSQAQEYLEDYDRRNYKVARPIEPFNPCRSDEFFNVINNRKYIIHDISYNVYSGKVHVDVSLFNNVNKRMTRITGETDIKEGYCYYKQASSNLYYQREAVFSAEPLDGYKQLFYYRVSRNDTVIISGKIDELGLSPYDSSHYSLMQEDSEVASSNEPYLANDFECLCVIGHPEELRVRLNGGIIMQGYGFKNQKYCIVYVTPGDYISGEYDRIFRIRYFSDSNAPKEYYTLLWNQNNLNLLDEHAIFTNRVEVMPSTSEQYYQYTYLHDANIGFNYSDTNKCVYKIGSSNYMRFPLQNYGYVALGALKFIPQKGKGLYEDEPNDIYRIDYTVAARLDGYSLGKWSMYAPIGNSDIKVVAKMHASDGTVVDTWSSAYRLSQLDWTTINSIKDYGRPEWDTDKSREPKLHYFKGYFERKLPTDGYLTFEIYTTNINAHISGGEDVTHDLSFEHFLVGITNLSATFYKSKFTESELEEGENTDV